LCKILISSCWQPLGKAAILGRSVRRVATWRDPRATREELSATLLGHPTYLKGKPGGENSLSGKAGCREAAQLHAGPDPDGKVKAALPEPQCPSCKPSGLETAAVIQLPLNPTQDCGVGRSQVRSVT
jgi:hypothetical protein